MSTTQKPVAVLKRECTANSSKRLLRCSSADILSSARAVPTSVACMSVHIVFAPLSVAAVTLLEPAVDFQKHAGDNEKNRTTDDGGLLTFRAPKQYRASNN